MKNSNDWRDSLAALRGTMGEAEEEAPLSASDIAEPASAQGRLDIVLEKKGRAGKSATIICGFTLPDSEVAAIAADLKRALGCGGSARGGEILIQGDRRTDVLRHLASRGLKARILG